MDEGSAKVPDGWKRLDDSGIAPPREEMRPTNDKFTARISDGDRRIILSGATPVLIEAIAETVAGLGEEEKRQVMQEVVSLGTTGASLSEQVQSFLKAVKKEADESLAPFHNGSDSSYLSILCGVIEISREEGEGFATRFEGAFSANFSRLIKSTPDKENTNLAAETFKTNLRGAPIES